MSRRRHVKLCASWLVASPFALLLLLLAISGAAAHQSGHLSNASVSPRQVESGGAVILAVTYTDAGGAPQSVVAQIGDARKTMIAGSADFTAGVRYTVSMTPAVGWHAVAFRATDSVGTEEVLWAGDVQVTDPGSSPAPTSTTRLRPASTPTPAATATVKPAPTPIAGARGGRGCDGDNGGTGSGDASPAPGAGQATPRPHATPAPAGAVTPAPGDPSQSGPRMGGSAATNAPGAAGGQPARNGNADPGDGTGGAVGTVGGQGATSNVAGGGVQQTNGATAVGVEPVFVDPLAPYRSASLPTLLRELAPSIAAATTSGAAWAAFVIFGKRRRDGDQSQPDLQLATAAASGVDTGAAPGLRVVDESLLPRWRRPSLQQVRKTDPLRVVTEAPHLSFEAAGVRPLESYERRHIRYRLVRLLDSPDEVRAAEIGVLDRGDEVQLLERRGVYWRVLCPDGRTGWVHRMTLGEPGSEPPTEVPAAIGPAGKAPRESASDRSAEPFEPRADIPGAADPKEKVDGLLEAYMRARGDLLRQAEPAEQVASVAWEPEQVVEAAAELGAVEPTVEPTVVPTVEPAATAIEAPAVALARDYLERAGFAVQGPELPIEPVETQPVIVPSDGASSESSRAAEPEHAGARCSGRKSAGSRKASSGSRPGTRSRRPSR